MLSTFSIYKIIFMTELLIGEVLFAFRLKRRKYFIPKVTLCLVALYVIAIFFPVPVYNAWYMSFLFLTLFGLTLLGLYLCFEEKFRTVLFCSIAGYTIQHIAYTINMILVHSIGFTQFDPYSPEDFNVMNAWGGWQSVIYIICYFTVYWIAFFVLSGKLKEGDSTCFGNIKYLFLAGFIVLINIILNMVTQYNTEGDIVSQYLEWIYNLLTCIAALVIQFGLFRQKEMQIELDYVTKLLSEEEKQYRMIKANLDAINVKVHDLKHYIHSLKDVKRGIGDEEVCEMESLVSLYESIVKTGNETLDIVLTEKLYYCNSNQVKMTYIVDGEAIAFMRTVDVYALFGNALDNAIEAVLKVEENKRNISFYIKKVGNMVSIHVENYFDGKISMVDNLPETSKNDRLMHGFGIMSMKVIVEKYGGTMSVEILENVFNLNIIIPHIP